jgi:aminodeoxyfutalosine synthase
MSDMLQAYAARLASGERLADAEMLALATTADILTLGMLADDVRRRKHGTSTTFVRVMDVPVPLADRPLAIQAAAGELRLVGAVDSLASASAEVAKVKATAGGVPVSAFSLADIARAAAKEQKPLDGVLRELRDAGLDLVAEAPLDELADARHAFEAAHRAGLPIARVTIAKPAPAASRLALMNLASGLQRSVGGIRSVAPLPRAWDPSTPTTGYEDVRFVAAARLLLENVPSIQIDWALYGPKLAQVALTFGADDVDGVSAAEGGDEGHRRAPLEEIRRNIKAAFLDPVERDGRYQTVAR